MTAGIDESIQLSALVRQLHSLSSTNKIQVKTNRLDIPAMLPKIFGDQAPISSRFTSFDMSESRGSISWRFSGKRWARSKELEVDKGIPRKIESATFVWKETSESLRVV